jgi:hypothetical protein
MFLDQPGDRLALGHPVGCLPHAASIQLPVAVAADEQLADEQLPSGG